MRHRIRLLLASRGALAPLFIVLAACTTGLPRMTQEEAPVPPLSVGDSWTYVLRDGYTNIDLTTRTERVVDAGADGYGVTVTLPTGDQRQEWTPGLNTRVTIDGVAGDDGALDFPLAVGRKWKSLAPFDNARATGVLDLQCEVVAIDAVQVPAGAFDAWRIACRGQWIARQDHTASMPRRQGRFEDIRWYAPAVKRIVRREQRSYLEGPSGTWTRTELTRYALH